MQDQFQLPTAKRMLEESGKSDGQPQYYCDSI